MLCYFSSEFCIATIMNKILAVTMGEPAGVGGEIILKAWQARVEQDLPAFFTIDNIPRLKAIAPDCPIKEISTPDEAMDAFNHALPVLNIDLPEKPKLGALNPANGRAVLTSIEMGVEFCMKGEASAMVTNPIHKAALYNVGFKHPGHTEFIAHLCGENETPVMMLMAKDLRCVPLTVHIPLKDVPQAVTQALIIEKARILRHALQQDFGIQNPHIAVAGLNPHAGEDNKIGFEDSTVIAPAIEALRQEGVNITGPHPADTMFHEQARAQYDAAIGMYHDQALIPVKTIDFHGGVNITLGLSVVRTSPDHGTALDIAGQNIANYQSLMNAIKAAAQIVENRT